MPKTEPTPEMIALARDVAAKDAESHKADLLASNIRAGLCDDTISVRCALAAIAEVTERAAELAESESAMAAFRGETCSEDMAAEYGFEADYAASIATALRNGDHLHD